MPELGKFRFPEFQQYHLHITFGLFYFQVLDSRILHILVRTISPAPPVSITSANFKNCPSVMYSV